MKHLSALFMLAAVVLFTGCGPAPKPEPVEPISFGDALDQINDVFDDSPAFNFSGDRAELDGHEALIEDYVHVLEEFIQHGEHDAELAAKKLDVEERAKAFGDEWEGKEQMSPGCVLRLVELQMKFTIAAATLIDSEFGDALNSDEFVEALEALEDFETGVEPTEESVEEEN
jgi:hypothetical protein